MDVVSSVSALRSYTFYTMLLRQGPASRLGLQSVCPRGVNDKDGGVNEAIKKASELSLDFLRPQDNDECRADRVAWGCNSDV
jgi:hypothetical protein